MEAIKISSFGRNEIQNAEWYATSIEDLAASEGSCIGDKGYLLVENMPIYIKKSNNNDQKDWQFVGNKYGGGNSIIDDFISGNLTDLTSNAESISDFALAYMNSIKKVSFPKAKTIGQSVFVSSGVQELYAPQLTTIGSYAFSFSTIKNIDLPLATSAGTAAFKDTTALTNVNLPNLTKISNNMFESSKLNELHVPLVTSVGTYAFKNAHQLVVLDLPKISGFPSSAFQNMGQRNPSLQANFLRAIYT